MRGSVFPLMFVTLAAASPAAAFTCALSPDKTSVIVDRQSQFAAGVMHGDMPLRRAGRHGEYHLHGDNPGRREGLVRLHPAGRRQELWRARRR
jgi:hypothetical protein